jgi:hypothetical protein
MTLTLTPAARTAVVNALVDLIDGGSGAGYLVIRSGIRPASAADTETGSELATVTLEDPAFGGGAAGVATIADPDPVAAVATGTATWFRVYDSSPAAVFDGKVTETGGDGDLTLATVDLIVDMTVDVTGGTITAPAGTAD